MKVTEKQVAAIEFINSNPGARVDEIAQAAGASWTGSNGAEFLRRLIDNGFVQVTLTADVQAALDGDDFSGFDDAALSLHRFMHEGA